MYRSLERIKAIADAVARDARNRFEIVGVTPGADRQGYAEIVVVRREAGSDGGVLTIGIDRNLPEATLREQIATQLA